MKRFILSIAIFSFGFGSPLLSEAEDADIAVRRYYLTLSNTERSLNGRSSGASIVADQYFATKAGLSKEEMTNIARFRFQSLQEAMNFLSAYGWNLAEAYSTTLGGSATTTWVIYKDVRDDARLADGLTLSD